MSAVLLMVTALILYFASRKDLPVIDNRLNQTDRENHINHASTEINRHSLATLVAPSPTPSHPVGINAADLYKNASVLFNGLSDEEKRMIRRPRDEVDAAKAETLFKKIQPIMALLRQAKDAAYCDWAMEPPKSMGTALPQMQLVMTLGQVARWSAGYEFLSSDPDAAVTDLMADAQIGRSIGDQYLIGFLVGSSINKGILELMQSNAGVISPQNTNQLLGFLSNTATNDQFSRSMEMEAGLLTLGADRLTNPDTRNAEMQELQYMITPPGANEPEISPEAIIAGLRRASQIQKDFAEKASLPDAQFQAWWNQVTQDSANPLVTSMLQVLPSMRDRYQTTIVNNSMLAVGLAVLQGDPRQIALQVDPTTGQPFTYVETPDGFQLQSKLQSKGKPLTMSFTYPVK